MNEDETRALSTYSRGRRVPVPADPVGGYVWVVLELSDYEQSVIIGAFRDKAAADSAVAENRFERDAYKIWLS